MCFGFVEFSAEIALFFLNNWNDIYTVLLVKVRQGRIERRQMNNQEDTANKMHTHLFTGRSFPRYES